MSSFQDLYVFCSQ